MRDSVINNQLEPLFEVLICRWWDSNKELGIIEKDACNAFQYPFQVLLWVDITCGLARGVTYDDTPFNALRQRRNFFEYP
jgi:hypothetical protein